MGGSSPSSSGGGRRGQDEAPLPAWLKSLRPTSSMVGRNVARRTADRSGKRSWCSGRCVGFCLDASECALYEVLLFDGGREYVTVRHAPSLQPPSQATPPRLCRRQ